jgi:hypothetical protein
MRYDPVALFESHNPLAQPGDHPRRLVTRNVWQPRDVGESVYEVKVGSAYPARPSLHENFVSDDIWDGDAPYLQGPPDFIEDCCLQTLITQSQFSKNGYRFFQPVLVKGRRYLKSL